ncbi:hypothetical protein Tco_0869066 [Tanacetum coccineum]
MLANNLTPLNVKCTLIKLVTQGKVGIGSILKSVGCLKRKGIDLLSFCTRIIANGDSTKFWDDLWCGEQLLKYKFHYIFMLDFDRDCLVANRIPLSNWHSVFRRNPRGGVESFQFEALQDALKDVVLSDRRDSWKWSLDNSVGFSVASVRRLIDSRILVVDQNATRWNR